jgi:hypothetical protein
MDCIAPSSSSAGQDGDRTPEQPMTASPPPAEDAASLPAQQLMALLREDRLWLLRQLDAGRWSDVRLDLAALERELGQLLDLAEEQLGPS